MGRLMMWGGIGMFVVGVLMVATAAPPIWSGWTLMSSGFVVVISGIVIQRKTFRG